MDLHYMYIRRTIPDESYANQFVLNSDKSVRMEHYKIFTCKRNFFHTNSTLTDRTLNEFMKDPNVKIFL